MGRRKVYGENWRQQIVELPHDVGELVEAMSLSSGLSLDGVIRASMRIEAGRRGADLAPWIRPTMRTDRRRPAKVGAPRRTSIPARDCRRVGLMVCRLWPLAVLGGTVTAAAIEALTAMRSSGWDAEMLRAEAMRLPPLFADADSRAAEAPPAAEGGSTAPDAHPGRHRA